MIAGLGKRSGLRYQLDVRLPSQQDLHEISEVGMVLYNHDTYLLCPCIPTHFKSPCGKGTRNRTLVPRSTSLSISSSPPISAARSRMLLRPTPDELSDPNPFPSSDTSTRRSPLSIFMLTETLVASECLRALVSASWIMRERSEEHTSELQSHSDLVCRLL